MGAKSRADAVVWQDALDRAVQYYFAGMSHILEECGNDEPRVSHIREIAESAIRAATAEVAAVMRTERGM